MSDSYKAVVKKVAEGLTPEEIEEMKFSLRFKTNKKSAIKTGFDLIIQMEAHDLIDEEENRLEKLQELLEEHDKKKLAKTVKKFLDSKSKESDEPKQDKEDTETGTLQKTQATFQTTVPSTQAPPGYFPNNNTQAHPGYFHDNQYGTQCTSPASSIMHQQGYPISQSQQHYQPSNYPPHVSPGPSMQMMQPPNQYFFPQHSAGQGNQNGGFPSNGYPSNQMQPPSMMTQGILLHNQYQQFQQQAPGQTQSDFHQQTCPPIPQQYAPRQMQPLTGQSLAAQNTYQNQNTNAQRLPKNSTQGLKIQNEIPPNIPSSCQLQGQRSESFSDNEIEDVVSDTPIASFEGLTLNDSIGSLKSVEPVAKVPVRRPERNYDEVVGDGTRVNNVPASAVHQETRPVSNAQGNAPTYQPSVPMSSGEQRVHAQPASAVSAQIKPASNSQFNASTQPMSSMPQREPAQPASAMYGVRLRESASAFDRWLQDGRKVTSFQKDGYELRIFCNSTQPQHYETVNGNYVMLPWQSEYEIYISNNTSHRCAAIVNYDGNKYVGDFELRSQGMMDIKGPPFEAGKFCFVKPELAGVPVDNPDNGVITAAFTPEKINRIAAGNDLSRGIGHQGLVASDHPNEYLEDDDWPTVESDAVSFNMPTFGSTQAQSDVSRSVMGGGRGPTGPPSGLRSGATVLVGQSDQKFETADDFEVDETKKVEITLRLVGLE